MKVKEISGLASVTWSPGSVQPIYLACGTSAQQLDGSFNSNCALTIYDLNIAQPNLEAKVVSTIESPGRFHSLQWGTSEDKAAGLIYGGCDNKSLYIYDASKLLTSQPDSLVGKTEGLHAGPVFTVSNNSIQKNLVATGSSECEISVWDINKLDAPNSPGKRPQISADVSCVSFNRQVAHILASTYAGHCVMWDLRKQTSIISISDTVSRMKAKNICWNPSVATQLLLACDDDSTPWIQLWDLRYANQPIKTLLGHQRGILKTMWCVQDDNILISASKDNKIYVWNPNLPNGSEIIGEFPSYNQWSYDMAWCDRDPSLVAMSSVDSYISVYSILGGGIPPQQTDKFSAIADSFPGMEMPAVVPQGVSPQAIQLKYTPKWFPKPAGVRFSFGGRLVSWNKESRGVTVSQVITEPELVERAKQLEDWLSQDQLDAFCTNKAQIAAQVSTQKLWNCSDANFEEKLWNCIGANFKQVPLSSFMEILGFSKTQVSGQLKGSEATADAVNTEELVDKMANLASTNEGSTGSLDPSEQFEMIASAQAVEAEAEQVVEAESNKESPEVETVMQKLNLDTTEDEENSQGLLTQALLVGDLESAVELCLKRKLYPHALSLAAHSSPELFAKTRDFVLSQIECSVAPMIGAIVRGDLSTITNNCDIAHWKEALTALLTYSDDQTFPSLAESLGQRLEDEGNLDCLPSAIICYVMAGSLNKFAACWLKLKPGTKPGDLQDLVEVIMVLQRSLSAAGRPANLSEGSTVSSLLCQYASLLAAQGSLNTAVSYLNTATQGEMVELRDRLYRALGYATGGAAQQTIQQSRKGSVTPGLPGRRSSTPYSQHQPTQFTPSVQAQQQSVYGTQAPMAPQPPVGIAPPTQFFNPTTAAPPQAPNINHPRIGAPPMGAPPMGAPPMGAPPMGAPPMGAPPMGAPPMGAPPMGAPPMGAPTGSTPMHPMVPTPATGPPPIGSTVSGVAPGMGGPSFFTPGASPMAPAPGSAPASSFGEPLSAKTPAALDPTAPRGWNDPPPLSAGRKSQSSQVRRFRRM